MGSEYYMQKADIMNNNRNAIYTSAISEYIPIENLQWADVVEVENLYFDILDIF